METEAAKVHYTYADYYLWDDGKRWELIDGVPYDIISTTPPTVHQRISGNLLIQLMSFLKGKPGMVFIAPFDVRLNADTADDTVVQPDLVVVCDRSKLDDRGCKDVPDMLIEILSPVTVRHDRLTKFRLYRKVGVRELWLVDPESRTVQAFLLEDGRYTADMYGDTGIAPVRVLEGCELDLAEVFAE